MFGFSPTMMTKSGPPALGEFWTKQGGYYIGSITDGGIFYYLVLAPKATGQQFCYWRIPNTNSPGTDSLTNGPANTLTMSGFDSSAASFVNGLTINGFTDWYLGALNELLAVQANKSSLPVGEEWNATRYWSSTQSSSSNAWRLNPSSGSAESNTKNGNNTVRAMRRVAA